MKTSPKLSRAGGIFLPMGILAGGLLGHYFGNVTIGVLGGLVVGLIIAGIFAWLSDRNQR